MENEVSVIIPCRAADAVIAPQLAALAAQRDAPTFQVMLCDNGENADLGGVARQTAPGLRVEVLDATREAGTAYARNVGIEHARTEKLLFCDADDVVGPTWVRDGARALDDVPAFSGGAIEFTADALDRSLDEVWRELIERLPAYAQADDEQVRGTYPVLLGCSFGMRRDFATGLRGFDRAFGAQAEDNDVAFRIQDALGSLPRRLGVVIAYRVRPESEASLRRSFEAGYKHARLCARHDAWHLSPSYLGHWVVRPLRQALTGRGVHGPRLDALGCVLGLVVGRVRFSLGSRPVARLGV